MRTGLWISILLLAITMAAGWREAEQNRRITERYVSAAEEILALVEMNDWERGKAVVSAYIEDWMASAPWLQMRINHDDIDDVTHSLVGMRAAIQAQDLPACYQYCEELKENARHISHRDAFTLGNVL